MVMKQKDKIKGQRPAAKELLVTPEVGVGDTVKTFLYKCSNSGKMNPLHRH